jgi:uncharacterized alpha-E superfamily protein
MVSAFEALLAIAHSIKTYRRRYRSQLQLSAVLDLLLLDENNPRSAGHQLRALETLLAELDSESGGQRSPAWRLALDALTQVRLFDADSTAGGDVGSLDEMLARVNGLLATLSDELSRRYFSHADAPHQLVRIV